jgi:hypothetical protein
MRDLESREQIEVVNWFRKHYPTRLRYSVPNGGWRDKITAHKLKMEGLEAGVPDLHFPEPLPPYPGLYIEMKRNEGGKTSPKQKEWIAALKERGFKVLVCDGAIQAKTAINEYFGEEHEFD